MLIPDQLRSVAGLAGQFRISVSNWMRMILLSSMALAYGGLFYMHVLHERSGIHELNEIPPALHWLRDASLAFPAVIVAIMVGMSLWKKYNERFLPSKLRKPILAVTLAVATTVVFILGVPLHEALFGGDHVHEATVATPVDSHSHDAGTTDDHHDEEEIFLNAEMVGHALHDGLASLSVNLGIAALLVLFLGGLVATNEKPIPAWKLRKNPVQQPVWYNRFVYKSTLTILAFVAAPTAFLTFGTVPPAAAGICNRTVFADVVALDQQFVYNRIGAWNPAGMIYALRRDVVDINTGLTEAEGGTLTTGQVALRTDKRPRPIVLRANVGDCLEIRFANLLNPIPVGGQPADRSTGIHVDGLQLVHSLGDDGSFVGTNASSLVAPGGSTTYTLYAQYENTFLLYNMGVISGGEASGGTTSYGLFGAVNVEPAVPGSWGAEWYRSQLTRVEMDWATPAETFTDVNGNGVWDAALAEPLTTDWNGNGVFDSATPEPFTDWNGNGILDKGIAEPLMDWNGNGIQDNGIAEPLTDWNLNSVQDNGIAEPFVDVDGDGVFTIDVDTFTDWNVNGIWDASLDEPFTDWNENGAWDVLLDEPFTDWNANQAWDASVDEPFTDWNSNGTWDASLADIFTDLNGNGVWDTQLVDPIVDTNGDGIWNAHRTTPGGQPILDYDAVYPAGAGFGKDGTPILNMLAPKAGYAGEIVHSDINAIITGPGRADFPNNFYPANGVYGSQDRNEPFREFTVIFHDEIFAVQAFPQFYNDPTLNHALAIVKDGFAINYGTGGIGSEIIANRLGVGPMANCVECKYEEFFLTSPAVGDPAMIVDTPANLTIDPVTLTPNGLRATKVLYPDDPSNVHHSYLNDHVKFRQLHAGPAEHHIFHLHAHQWQFNWNDPNSNYLDSQGIGPGSGFTYEIAYGGSGNRNKSPGDAIFHCHFYPHFAMGMWELWRVHDTFETGTELNADGTVATHARALPDGEITAGTPIPGVVPLPSETPTLPNQGRSAKAMAPMPDLSASVTPYDVSGDGVLDSSQLDLNADGVADLVDGFAAVPAINPGYPFYIPSVAGHRPPTPVLDMLYDGGLPRHIITGGQNIDPQAGAVTHIQYQTRLDFNKELLDVGYAVLPENGTPAEQVAMAYHSQLWHDSYLSDGTPVSALSPVLAANGRSTAGFETNGLPPQAGAPFADPCRTDPTAANGWAVNAIAQNKIYKGVNIQFDMTMNKVGWHFPQQRILTLWDDAAPVLAGTKAPEPLVMRLNVGDCASYWHANLVPNVYELDDYQVRTPTDIIGQHIHLVKFDVTASDGSANGFNYEDGTLSPMEVQERIHAIRTHNACAPGTVSAECPEAVPHPFFGAGPDNNGDGVGDWVGARTTIQRWYADPVLNNSWDQGLGTVFTHDHYGPSTHQQVGLYATVLVEPAGAQYRDPETGIMMGTRDDGGPTSWRADILNVFDAKGNNMSHREFYFEFADFQHAYHAGGAPLTTIDNGAGVTIPSYADFNNAIAPSFRVKPPAGFEDSLYFFPPVCPGPAGVVIPRPCPEAISGADPGTYVANYRNEPLSERLYDPNTKMQAVGQAGDLAYAFSSLITRAQPALNLPFSAYPPLTADIAAGDPATPLLRTYMGDRIRLRVQVGAHEEEHNFMIHGLKWQKEAHTQNSGWKNSEFLGISEYSIFEMPIVPDTGAGDPAKIDYMYTMGAQVEDYWNGIWGLLRSYGKPRPDLLPLPNNPMGTGVVISNAAQFNQMCPVSAPVVNLKVTAVRAADILPGGSLIYNTRDTTVIGPTLIDPVTGEVLATGPTGRGPLHDPTALMYFRDSDLTYDPVTHKPNGLRPGVPVEPLILRARAGDCINLQLTNALPSTPLTWTDPNGVVHPDMPGFSTLPAITHKDVIADPALGNGIITFNANDLTPSNSVGLHPQLLAYNVRTSDGFTSGGTAAGTIVAPGAVKVYKWYAGDVDAVPDTTTAAANDYNLVATPVEFGATGLLPADRIKGSNKGLVGALIIEPKGSSWVEDPASRASATVTKSNGSRFRDFVIIMQNDLNLRYTADNVTCTPALANLFCGVPNIHSEGGFVPEDPQDSGQKAINYGADPLWFRLGVAPETPFEMLLGNTNINRVYSNTIVPDGSDPQTAVFLSSTTGPVETRMRVVMPGGHSRGIVFTFDGHAWQTEPYINNSTEIGGNGIAWRTGTQEGISAGSIFNVVTFTGGDPNGDYLFRDHAAFGNYQGLWGIFRKSAANAPMAGADFYATPKNVVLNVAAPGVLVNDVDVDGDALTAQLIGTNKTTAGGTVTLNTNGSFSYTPPLGFTGLDSFQYQACGGGACSIPVKVSITVGNAPVAANNAYSMAFGTPSMTIAAPGLLANDTDVDGDPLVVGEVNGVPANVGTPVTLASGSTLTVNADGSLTYVPATTFVGTEFFNYRACENITAPFLCSNLATVTIKVNAPPTAVADSYNGKKGTTLSVGKPGVLGNDFDLNGDVLSAVQVTGPVNASGAATGTLTLRSDGSFSYNPPKTFVGSVTFTYKACEASTTEKLCSAPVKVTIVIK